MVTKHHVVLLQICTGAKNGEPDNHLIQQRCTHAQ